MRPHFTRDLSETLDWLMAFAAQRRTAPVLFPTADPDLVFVTDCCGDTPETVAERPGWDNVSAVRNGAVTVVDDDVSSRWGPRLDEFFQTVSDAIVRLAG